jgi:hypothetical protein
MNINKFLIKDNKGLPSVTLTAFILGFVVVNAKLIFSGMEIMNLKIEQFSGGEYAAAIGALGAVYILRRNTDKSEKKDDK